MCEISPIVEKPVLSSLPLMLPMGYVRKVQKLSRHRQLDTLILYNDNRERDQREVTRLLDDLV